MAALLPASYPVHNLEHPEPLTRSLLTICITNFPEIFCRTSPISIDLKPEFLYNGASLNAKNASCDVSLDLAFTSIFLVQIFFMVLAKNFSKSMFTVP